MPDSQARHRVGAIVSQPSLRFLVRAAAYTSRRVGCIDTHGATLRVGGGLLKGAF
jgi:hypothetical protein